MNKLLPEEHYPVLTFSNLLSAQNIQGQFCKQYPAQACLYQNVLKKQPTHKIR